MTEAPTPISAASTAGEGSASPRHSLGAVSGATTKADQIRAYIAEHYPNGMKRGDAMRVSEALGIHPTQVSSARRRASRKSVHPPGPKATLILDYINRVFPCGAIPYGAITEISEVFGLTRQRVHQITKKYNIERASNTPKIRVCKSCDAPAEKGKMYCSDHQTVVLSCGMCQKEFRISHHDLKARLNQRGGGRKAPQFFCSKSCSGSWSGITHGFGVHKKGGYRNKTHCIHGHEFTPENTYLFTRTSDGGQGRQCKACNTARKREAWKRKSLPPASATSGTTLTPSSEPAPVQAGSSVTPASTSGAQP